VITALYVLGGLVLLFPVTLVWLIVAGGLHKALDFVPWHFLGTLLGYVWLLAFLLPFLVLDMAFNLTWGWLIFGEPAHFHAALGFLPLPELFSDRVERLYRQHAKSSDGSAYGKPELLDPADKFGAKVLRWAAFVNTFNPGDITFNKG
jgi:hypothetical protein